MRCMCRLSVIVFSYYYYYHVGCQLWGNVHQSSARFVNLKVLKLMLELVGTQNIFDCSFVYMIE